MSKIIVAGLANLETSLQIDSFPIDYKPLFHSINGIHSHAGGNGYNIASALTHLGDQVIFFSLTGRDIAAGFVRDALVAKGILTTFVLEMMAHTPQSVILLDKAEQRQVYADLKDIQEITYPPELFHLTLQDCDLAVVCNIDFARPFLPAARQAGKRIATDVHAIADLDDVYNHDFMAAADILFMSDENLPCPPQEWCQRVMERFPAEIVVIGLGAQGVQMAVRRDSYCKHLPALQPTASEGIMGAGDALLACFVHYYAMTADPYLSIKEALHFAAHKINAVSATEEFSNETELDQGN